MFARLRELSFWLNSLLKPLPLVRLGFIENNQFVETKEHY